MLDERRWYPIDIHKYIYLNMTSTLVERFQTRLDKRRTFDSENFLNLHCLPILSRTCSGGVTCSRIVNLCCMYFFKSQSQTVRDFIVWEMCNTVWPGTGPSIRYFDTKLIRWDRKLINNKNIIIIIIIICMLLQNTVYGCNTVMIRFCCSSGVSYLRGKEKADDSYSLNKLEVI